MKTCPKCCETKDLSEFHTRRVKDKTYPAPYCKPCALAYSRKRTAEGYQKKTRQPQNINTRISWLRRLKLFGLTEDQYYEMLESQAHMCAICGTETPWSRSDKWPIDHCHTTGKVRGLLCHRCNTGIGLFYDNPDILASAIEYLKGHASGTVLDTADLTR